MKYEMNCGSWARSRERFPDHFHCYRLWRTEGDSQMETSTKITYDYLQFVEVSLWSMKYLYLVYFIKNKCMYINEFLLRYRSSAIRPWSNYMESATSRIVLSRIHLTTQNNDSSYRYEFKRNSVHIHIQFEANSSSINVIIVLRIIYMLSYHTNLYVLPNIYNDVFNRLSITKIVFLIEIYKIL